MALDDGTVVAGLAGGTVAAHGGTDPSAADTTSVGYQHKQALATGAQSVSAVERTEDSFVARRTAFVEEQTVAGPRRAAAVAAAVPMKTLAAAAMRTPEVVAFPVRNLPVIAVLAGS